MHAGLNKGAWLAFKQANGRHLLVSFSLVHLQLFHITFLLFFSYLILLFIKYIHHHHHHCQSVSFLTQKLFHLILSLVCSVDVNIFHWHHQTISWTAFPWVTLYHQFPSLSLCPPASLSVYLSLCLSVCHSVHPSVTVCPCHSVHLSLNLSICHSVHLSLCSSISNFSACYFICPSHLLSSLYLIWLSPFPSLSLCPFVVLSFLRMSPDHCI